MNRRNELAEGNEVHWVFSEVCGRFVRLNRRLQYQGHVSPYQASRAELEAAERAWAKGERHGKSIACSADGRFTLRMARKAGA